MNEPCSLISDFGDADTRQIIAQFQKDMETAKKNLGVEELRVTELVVRNDESRNRRRSLEQKRMSLRSVASEIKEEANRWEEKIHVSQKLIDKLKKQVSSWQSAKADSDATCIISDRNLEECKESYVVRTLSVIEKITDLLENYKPSKLYEAKLKLMEELRYLQEELGEKVFEENRLNKEKHATLTKTNLSNMENDNKEDDEYKITSVDVDCLLNEVCRMKELLDTTRIQIMNKREEFTAIRNSRRHRLSLLKKEGEALEKICEDLYYSLCSTKSAVSTSYCKSCKTLLLH